MQVLRVGRKTNNQTIKCLLFHDKFGIVKGSSSGVNILKSRKIEKLLFCPFFVLLNVIRKVQNPKTATFCCFTGHL